MPTKLKNLRVSKVDFVDSGANPDAHIMLFKRAPNAEEVQKKNAFMFSDSQKEKKLSKICDEIWDMCFALSSSLCSVLRDDDVLTTSETMKESLRQFNASMENAIDQWAAGNPLNTIQKQNEDLDVDFAVECKKRLEAIISQSEPKGDKNTMAIDKSLMTPAERAFYEDIEKRCSTDAKKSDEEVKEPDTEEQTNEKTKTKKSAGSDEDIYSGLHPAVAAELQDLRKRADEAESRELLSVAKKYEIIGKKAEELMPILKSLKQAGGSAYNDMISVLDASVAAVEKSGVFSEIGKSGGAGSNAVGAWAAIEKKADELCAANPNMNRYDAVDIVCQQNPQLVHEYENGN